MRLIPTAATLVENLPRPLRRHRLIAGWMMLTGEDPVQLVRIRDNYFGYADMGEGFLRLIVIDQHYNEEFFLVADTLLADGGTFFDVGANYGLLSFGLAGKHGAMIDFHLFEPNPKLVQTIARTKVLYPAMRCTLNTVAVSDKAGTVSFKIDEAHTGASHISVEGDVGIEVPALTLDCYIAEYSLEDIKLLKLDIEGFEVCALRGARRSLIERRIKAIYFEYSEKQLIRVGPPSELIEFLDSVGFVSCFARAYDYGPRGGPSHTVITGRAGHGLKLLPIAGHDLPPMTDLLAVPQEHLELLA